MYVVKEFEGFYVEEIAEQYKSYSEDFKPYYLEAFIEEIGKDLTFGKKHIFLTKNRTFQIVANIIGISEDEIVNKLKEINSSLADKYAILGFWNGRKIFKSEISGQIKPILKKLATRMKITDTDEFLAMMDALNEILQVEVL
jgi:CRISPR/Cas system CSM-associated protein Csm2 small subunit